MNHFSYSSLSEYSGPIGHLVLTADPRGRGYFGIFTDTCGIKWDVHGFANGHVLARKCSDAPGYYSTASDANYGGSHRWIPYTYEVEKQCAAT